MPTVVFGPDGLPRWTAETEEDERAWELVGVERPRLDLSGRLLSAALDQILADHGEPEETELALFLSREGTGDVPLSAAMARSLLRYWRGDYEGSLHTSIPRIEAAARRLVLSLDEPAYHVARGRSPGNYAGLPALLEILVEQGFDPDWDRFLRTFLLGPAGLNGRHDLAHGFNLATAPRDHAALGLRALGLFVSLLPAPIELAESTSPGESRVLSSSVAGAVVNLGRHVFARGVPLRVVVKHEWRAAHEAGRAAATKLVSAARRL